MEDIGIEPMTLGLHEDAKLNGQLWSSFTTSQIVLGVSATVALVALLPSVPGDMMLAVNVPLAGAAIGSVWRCARLVALVVQKAQEKPDETPASGCCACPAGGSAEPASATPDDA